MLLRDPLSRASPARHIITIHPLNMLSRMVFVGRHRVGKLPSGSPIRRCRMYNLFLLLHLAGVVLILMYLQTKPHPPTQRPSHQQNIHSARFAHPLPYRMNSSYIPKVFQPAWAHLRPRRSASKRRSSIPRLVHYVYVNGENDSVVEKYHLDMASCLNVNTDLTFILWTDWNLQHFVRNYVKDERLRDMATWSLPAAMRSDLFRYLLIYYFGGIYLDLDTECRKPMYDRYFTTESCWLSNEPTVQTKIVHQIQYTANPNYIACEPKHPLFKQLLDNFPNMNARDNSFYSTGPFYLTVQLEKYMKDWQANPGARRPEHYVHFLDQRVFGANMDEYYVRSRCAYLYRLLHGTSEYRETACRELAQYLDWYYRPGDGGEQQAVLVNDWNHLGYVAPHSLRQHSHFRPSQVFPQMLLWPPRDIVAIPLPS